MEKKNKQIQQRQFNISMQFIKNNFGLIMDYYHTLKSLTTVQLLQLSLRKEYEMATVVLMSLGLLADESVTSESLMYSYAEYVLDRFNNDKVTDHFYLNRPVSKFVDCYPVSWINFAYDLRDIASGSCIFLKPLLSKFKKFRDLQMSIFLKDIKADQHIYSVDGDGNIINEAQLKKLKAESSAMFTYDDNINFANDLRHLRNVTCSKKNKSFKWSTIYDKC